MIRLITILAALSLAAGSAFSGTETEKEAMFFAGVTLLEHTTECTPQEIALKFRELEALTGISAAQAGILLERYRESPADWQKVDSAMMKLLQDTRLAFQTNDTAKKTPGDTVREVLRKVERKSLFHSKFKR